MENLICKNLELILVVRTSVNDTLQAYFQKEKFPHRWYLI